MGQTDEVGVNCKTILKKGSCVTQLLKVNLFLQDGEVCNIVT